MMITQTPLDDSEDRLQTHLSALAGRVYSEEGVPMFLACENLVPDEPMAAISELNRDLAGAFRRDVAAWRRVRPDAVDKDAARIVEQLAEQDFSSGGTKTEL